MFYFFTQIKQIKLVKLSSVLALLICCNLTANSQHFLQNAFIECGFSGNGAMGSQTVAPPGYHPLGSSYISLVADPGMDGWAVGAPAQIGDLAYPGVIHEGWRIQVGTNRARAWIGSTAIEAGAGAITGGLVGGVTTIGGVMTSTWSGSYNGLSIVQVARVKPGTHFVRYEVTITNTTGATINNIYYERSTDPDHGTYTPGSGTSVTTNTIVSQPTGLPGSTSNAIVTYALSIAPALTTQALYALDCRARCFYMTSGLTPSIALNTIWTGGGSYVTTPGAQLNSDVGVGIVFNIGSLAPGETTTLHYAYVSKASDIPNVFSDMYAKWDINDVEYPNETVITSCVGATYDVEILSHPSIEWGTWSPTTGLASTSGSTNTITITGSEPITYTIYGYLNGCIIDTAIVTFNPLDDTTVINHTICSTSGTYEFHGTTYSTSGTYYFDTINSLGCDSIIRLNLYIDPILYAIDTVLLCNDYSAWPFMWHDTYPVFGPGTGIWTIVNESSGGCDSTTSLTVIQLPVITVEVNDTVCADAFPYFWGSLPIFAPGIHVANVSTTSSIGCDSTTYLNVFVQPPFETDIYDTVCSADLPFVWEGTTITAGGTRVASTSYSSPAYCDSIVYLSVHVLPETSFTETITICPADLPYTWHSHTLSAPGMAVATETFVGSNSCDSVVTLNLVLNPVITTPMSATICAGSTYDFYGTPLSSAGVYTDTFISSSGCDSVIMLTLAVDPVITSSSTVNICAGGSYIWGGVTYTTAGVFPLPGVNAAGCDTIHTLTIAVDPVLTSSISATICSGSSYEFYGTYITTPGTYTHTVTTGDCDTFVTLTLSVDPVIETSATESICAGSSFTWGGVVYTAPGVYPLPGVNAAGCDTLHTLTIIEEGLLTSSISASICTGGTYDFYGTILTTAGTYTETVPGVGCDTVVTLTLTVDPVIETSATETICAGGSFIWGGVTYSTPGVYPLPGVNAAGCDTLHTLTIVEDPVIEVPMSAAICAGGSYDFFGDILTDAGTYTHASSGGGCDSVYVLTLTVDDIIETSATETICAGGSFIWGGVTYTDPGEYPLPGVNAAGCDTVHTLTIIVEPVIEVPMSAAICTGGTYDFFGDILTDAGTYTHSSSGTGCDSLYVLTLTVDDVIETSATENICMGGSFVWAGVTYTDAGVYPLPGVNAAGCDTLHTLTIVIDPIIEEVITATICDGGSYDFFGTIYNTAGTFTHTTTGDPCDTLYVLNLSVEPVIETSATEYICAGGSFIWAGVTYAAPGVYPLPGVNAAGCDTLHTLTIIENPIIELPMSASICTGGTYNFFGTILNTPGVYNHTSTGDPCDTLYILTLTVDPIIETSSTVNICDGSTYTWGGVTYSTAGVYPLPGVNAAGCDTLHTLTIIVNPILTDSFTVFMCENENYNFYGTLLNTSGIYTHTETSGMCDTLKVLQLVVYDTVHTTLNHVICESALPSSILGVAIPVGTVSTPGFAAVDFTTPFGCDSIVTINLTVVPTLHTYLDTLLCYGSTMDFGGTTISEAGLYERTLVTSAGCDSIIHLTVNFTNAPIFEEIVLNGCGEVEFEGTIYTESIEFIDTFRTAYLGCDSLIRNVDINVLYSPRDTVLAEICYGESYEFNGRMFTSSTIVTDTFVYDNGCDSLITLYLTVNPLPNIKLNYEHSDDLICVFDTVDLIGNGGLLYKYYDGFDDYIGQGDKIWVMIPSAENLYYVVGYDENGCSDTSKVMIYANGCCDMLMPNAFSPNGDGLNDTYGPVTEGHPVGYRMEVYNRYGERIFVSHKVEDKWTGTYENGKQADAGTYFYIITGKCYDGTPIHFKGDVTLIR